MASYSVIEPVPDPAAQRAAVLVRSQASEDARQLLDERDE